LFNNTSIYSTAIAPVSGQFLVGLSSLFVVASALEPVTIGLYRMGVGGLIIAALFGPALLQVPRSRRWWLFTLGASGCWVTELLLWQWSIKVTGPAVATVLNNLQLFILPVTARIIWGERMSPRLKAALVVGAAGILLVTGVADSSFSGWAWDDSHGLGILYGVLSAFAYSGYVLLARQVSRAEPLQSPSTFMAVHCLFSALGFGTISIVVGAPLLVMSSYELSLMLMYAACCQVCGWILIQRSLARLSAAQISCLCLIQPFTAVALDLWFGLSAWSSPKGLGLSLLLLAFGLVAGVRLWPQRLDRLKRLSPRRLSANLLTAMGVRATRA
jgi:drug/metabolite transporter (DMT)-like permease